MRLKGSDTSYAKANLGEAILVPAILALLLGRLDVKGSSVRGFNLTVEEVPAIAIPCSIAE